MPFTDNLRIFFLFLIVFPALVIGLTACGSSKPVASDRSKQVKKPVTKASKKSTLTKQIGVSMDESFDPKSLNDQWVITPPKTYVLNSQYKADQITIFHNLEPPEKVVMGFRIQIKSTKNYDEAVEILKDAQAKFFHEIYLDYEPPYYKIRIGNFTQKLEAENLKSFSQEIGYADSWVVLTKVVIKSK